MFILETKILNVKAIGRIGCSFVSKLHKTMYSADMLDPELWRGAPSRHACCMCEPRPADNGGKDVRVW
jgi:hypothetical protein